MACSVQCGGDCCRAFTFPHCGMMSLAENYMVTRNWRDAGQPMEPYMHDTITVGEMVIPLFEEEDEMQIWTCRHLVRATGLCGIYEQRPQLCRDYPNGQTCGHCGYTEPVPAPKAP